MHALTMFRRPELCGGLLAAVLVVCVTCVLADGLVRYICVIHHVYDERPVRQLLPFLVVQVDGFTVEVPGVVDWSAGVTVSLTFHPGTLLIPVCLQGHILGYGGDHSGLYMQYSMANVKMNYEH